MATSGRSAKADLTDRQRQLSRTIDLATDTLLRYAAPEVPSMTQYTPEGMLEELGRINEGRKAFEATEKILKERMKSLLGEQKKLRSDNFHLEIQDKPRVALDQTSAKAKLEELGCLAEHMSTSIVPTMYIKPN
jgi:hypothetical protein